MSFHTHILAGVLAVTVVAAAAVTSPVRAETAKPWCGVDRADALECVYSSLAECEQFERSEGGDCRRNPALSTEDTGTRFGPRQRSNAQDDFDE